MEDQPNVDSISNESLARSELSFLRDIFPSFKSFKLPSEATSFSAATTANSTEISSFSLKISSEFVQNASIELQFTLPFDYPRSPPQLAIGMFENVSSLQVEEIQSLLVFKIAEITAESVGEPICYELVIAAQNILNSSTRGNKHEKKRDDLAIDSPNKQNDDNDAQASASSSSSSASSSTEDNCANDSKVKVGGVLASEVKLDDELEEECYEEDYDEEYYDEEYYDEEYYDEDDDYYDDDDDYYNEDDDYYEEDEDEKLRIQLKAKKVDKKNEPNPWICCHSPQIYQQERDAAAAKLRLNASQLPTECPICIGPMDTPSERVRCSECEESACVTCFQRGLVESDLTPTCMFLCKSAITQCSIIESSKAWYNLIYQPHLKNQLYKSEMTKMIRSQAAATAYIKAKEAKDEDPLMAFFKEEHRARCIENFGIGYENFDFDDQSNYFHVVDFGVYPPVRILSKAEKREIRQIFQCPQRNCRGWIDEPQDALETTCVACKHKICLSCREVIDKEPSINEKAGAGDTQQPSLAQTTDSSAGLPTSTPNADVATSESTSGASSDAVSTTPQEFINESTIDSDAACDASTNTPAASAASINSSAQHPTESESDDTSQSNSTLKNNINELNNKKTHVCNPDTVESVRVILEQSRPCPRCRALISKVDGCDQMFCTVCKTTYSWNTGIITKDTELHHNPHYFAWLRENPAEAAKLTRNHNILGNRVNADVPDRRTKAYKLAERRQRAQARYAQRYNQQDPQFNYMGELQLQEAFTRVDFNVRFPYSTPNTRFKPLTSEQHYAYIFLQMHRNILHVRAHSGNHANTRQMDNHDLRVRFIAGELTENGFKAELLKRHFLYHKLLAYSDVYMAVFNISGELFLKLFDVRIKKKFRTEFQKTIQKANYFYSVYAELQELIGKANDALERLDRAYGKDERFICFNRY